MALEVTFRDLSVCLHRLHDALNALQVTLGDKPADDESALADGVETVVLDLMGTLHEARKAALNARKAVGHPLDLDRARRALTICQERFHRIEQQFAADLVSYEKMKELARLGNARRAWLPWSSTVKQGIEQCQPPLEQTSAALAACWQELVEHSGTTSISVKNTGQKIIAGRALQKEMIRERMT
ncbi:MAG: hypothetical protein ABSH02_13025 [Candidatus Sulfotelmatobacter sp.]